MGIKTRGGGVILYLKNSLSAIIREDLIEPDFTECIWCEVIFEKSKTLLGVCYRPPDSLKNNDEALFKLLNKASKEKYLIMGDFNFASLNWSRASTLVDSHPFLKCINDNFLIQCVEENTRGNNMLDLIFTTEENMVENLVVGEPFGSSDHQIISWNFVRCKLKSCEEHVNLNYFKVDYEQMRQDAKVIN
mgnify:CR=1 FL=1